jgi:hypothetical protein
MHKVQEKQKPEKAVYDLDNEQQAGFDPKLSALRGGVAWTSKKSSTAAKRPGIVLRLRHCPRQKFTGLGGRRKDRRQSPES